MNFWVTHRWSYDRKDRSRAFLFLILICIYANPADSRSFPVTEFSAEEVNRKIDDSKTISLSKEVKELFFVKGLNRIIKKNMTKYFIKVCNISK